MRTTQFIHIQESTLLEPPGVLRRKYPGTDAIYEFVHRSRQEVRAILNGKDSRLLAVVGPCSLHDRESCLEYASRLAELARKVSDRLLIVMRAYFEKPRTSVGWKGLINDPHLNGSFDILEGLTSARKLLLDINGLGLAAATEVLEPITPIYISDLITIASLGARTIESPTHRQMASGLSMPVGYKNGMDGDLEVALNAMKAAGSPNHFVGINDNGNTCIIRTTGNPDMFAILRGGRLGPNYMAEKVHAAVKQLTAEKVSPRLVVDCSHGNSRKQYQEQAPVWRDVLLQRLSGNENIVGLMLESHLNPGKQELKDDAAQLKYGLSITDGCIGWDETESLILSAHEQLNAVPA